ncbi:polysaccharide deacetylase family protein [Paenibacillus tuaregi]|uniref:polysaccharide deacetylase family protein n=1 Tax=Paenibacillus tuaregi TaxID=1816681 RepID=UPI000B0ACBB1|nr:polysaccharide deacetylase family protein [Paenibacillus tuaregi]
MLILRSPMQYRPEREYIYRVVFEEFLGMDYSVIYEERDHIEIVKEGAEGEAHRLILADVLLRTAEEAWLQAPSMPQLPLNEAVIPGMGTVPVLYGRSNPKGTYIFTSGGGVECGIDIFGGCLFMLTRYEELVVPDRDRHNRFSAYSSVAYQAGFLDRPIVNEYVEILYLCIQMLWPELRRRERTLRTMISHDVDAAYFVYGRSRLSIAKESAMDILRRHDPESGLRKAVMLGRKQMDLGPDPFNTFDWLMSLSERHGIRSSFYFIAEETEPGMDGNYTLEDANIRNLFREIHARGHEIGLHPAYQTYLHPERIKRQFQMLRSSAEECGIMQDRWGGRQHYLRWQAPDTWQHWEDAGLHYDSTLSYADSAGFRCGVCYEFPVFNLIARSPLQLRERPLIVMDQSIVHPDYMGLAGDQALRAILHYYGQCAKYNGDFTLLWHNSQLVRSADRQLYQSCLEKLGSYNPAKVSVS